MQGVTTFAILVLFVCAQPWAASAQILQPCEFMSNGTQVGVRVVEEQRTLSPEEGPRVWISVDDVDYQNVIGSSLLFCDDLIDEVVMELAQDKKSYIVFRNPSSSAFYWVKYFISDEPPKVNNYQALRKRPLKLKRPHH